MKIAEHAHQANTCEWFHYQFPQYRKHLFAIPNGGARHKAVAGKLRAEGVVAGVADLFLMVARHGFHGLFIEMKAEGGRLTECQIAFKGRAEAQGYKHAVCWSADEARAVLTEYLA